MLGETTNEENLTVQACADILYAVHQEGEYSTLYSNIFDPVNLDLYFNYGDNYQKKKFINFLDTLSQEASFKKEDTYFGITGTQGHLLVKSVRIDKNFYYPSSASLPPLFYILTFLGVGGVSIPIGVFIYKRKKKENK